MPEVRISDLVAQPHLEYFNTTKPNQLDYGGRGSYKSSKNGIKIALQLIKDPNCEVVVIRQDKSDHRKSSFAELKIAFERLGVPLKAGVNYPEGQTSAVWIKLPKGNWVHFEQMKSIEKLKGMKPANPKNDIKIVWFFEITEFLGPEYIDEAKSGFIRNDKDYMWFLYEWNDPPMGHWVHEFKKKYKKRKDAYVKKTNYNDAPLWQQRKFLGDLMLQEIEMLKQVDYEQYKATYLAEPAHLSGAIYKKFDPDVHVKPVETRNFQKMRIGVDYGDTDATVFTLYGVLKGFNGVRVPKSYYHKNGYSEGHKDVVDYVNDFFDFAAKAFQEYGHFLEVEVDSAAKSFWNYLDAERRRRGIAYFKVSPTDKTPKGEKEKDAIEERIKTLELMFAAEFIEIDPSNKELIKAIHSAVRNKHGKRKDDETTNVDSLDSLEYAFLKDILMIYRSILRQRGYENQRTQNPSKFKIE